MNMPKPACFSQFSAELQPASQGWLLLPYKPLSVVCSPWKVERGFYLVSVDSGLHVQPAALGHPQEFLQVNTKGDLQHSACPSAP